MTAATFQFFWQDQVVSKTFRSGVSLHSHTMHSEESLEMVPRYTARLPYLGSAIRKQQAEYKEKKGDHLDFSRAFWTPPLAPREAHRLEEKQIQKCFGLPGFVSLTDHDDIRAGTHLQVLERFRGAPVSTEWTIPFGPTFFHLGVHNLPVSESARIMDRLASYTAEPNEQELDSLLLMLQAYEDVLLVLNHPCWDEKGIGAAEHGAALARLLQRHRSSFHALELNGLRSWNENKLVIRLGNELGMPVVGGGDRHGLEPNAIVNLSSGESFTEFICEVRYAKRSHVVFMPQYHEPLRLRILQTMVDVVREYPSNFDGRRKWSDRVFFRGSNAEAPLPMSAYWKDGGPAVVRHFVTAMKILERRSVRSALRMALDDRARVWSDQEAAV